MTKEMPELGRFAEPSLYILVSLSDGPKHGYAIMTDVEASLGRRWGRARSTERSPGSSDEDSSRRSSPRSDVARTGSPGWAPRCSAASSSRCAGSPAPASSDSGTRARDRASLRGRIGPETLIRVRRRPARVRTARCSPHRRSRRSEPCRRAGSRAGRCSVGRWRPASACSPSSGSAGPSRSPGRPARAAAPKVRVGTLDDLVGHNPDLPDPRGVPGLRAGGARVHRDRRPGDRAASRLAATRPATARRSTSGRCRSAARISAAARTRASRTSGSAARATSPATTGSGPRPPVNCSVRRPAAWTGTRSRSTPRAS